MMPTLLAGLVIMSMSNGIPCARYKRSMVETGDRRLYEWALSSAESLAESSHAMNQSIPCDTLHNQSECEEQIAVCSVGMETYLKVQEDWTGCVKEYYGFPWGP